MPDSDRIANAEVVRDGGEIAAPIAPVRRRRGLAAATVPARIHCKAAAPRQSANDAIPAARVKAGGMREEECRSVARPFPYGDLFAVGRDDVQFGGARHTPDYTQIYAWAALPDRDAHREPGRHHVSRGAP